MSENVLSNNCRTIAAAEWLVDTTEDTAKLVGIDNYPLELVLVSFALPVQVLNKNFSVFSKTNLRSKMKKSDSQKIYREI